MLRELASLAALPESEADMERWVLGRKTEVEQGVVQLQLRAFVSTTNDKQNICELSPRSKRTSEDVLCWKRLSNLKFAFIVLQAFSQQVIIPPVRGHFSKVALSHNLNRVYRLHVNSQGFRNCT